MAYVVVVVGGGSAGCVAASRLGSDERLQVLLIEAGPDYVDVGRLPPDVADPSGPTTGDDWGFVSEPDDLRPCGRARWWTGSSWRVPRQSAYGSLTARWSSYADPHGPPDLRLFAAGPFDDADASSGGAFGVVTGLLSPTSPGAVRLRSADPLDPPRIDVRHLRTAYDVARMVEATRHARKLSRTPPLAGFVLGAERAPALQPPTRTTRWPLRSRPGSAATTTQWGPSRWAHARTRVPSSTRRAQSTALTACGWPTRR